MLMKGQLGTGPIYIRLYMTRYVIMYKIAFGKVKLQVHDIKIMLDILIYIYMRLNQFFYDSTIF